MQQPQPAMGTMGSVPPTSITTEQIQRYLDENKQLILAILDNQNLGRLNECAQYQAQLQKNLLYLAAIADAQPQSPAVRLQMMPQGAAATPQAGNQFMQQQSPNFPPKTGMQFTPQQVQELQQQQLQHQPHMMPPFQGQMGMRPMNGMQAAMHADSSLAYNTNNKQDAGNAAYENTAANTDGSIQKKTANDDLDPSAANPRRSEDAKSS